MTEIPPPPPGFQLIPEPPKGFVLQPTPPTVQPPTTMEAMDRKRGAPAAVRNLVGSARTPEDRLSTLRQFYPDAQPYGEDNFVFADPKTGRPTLYNPPGLDVGDMASVAPEAAEMVGGAVGGVAALPGAVVAAPATGGASLLTVPVGVGLGAAGAREVYDTAMTRLFGVDDTRPAGTRVVDAGVTAGANAVGQRVGEMAGRAVSAVFGPITQRIRRGVAPGGPAALQDFAQTGVPPLAGAVTGNRGVQMVEQGLGNTPGGASVIQQAAERAIAALDGAVTDTATGYGPQRTVQGVGETVRRGAQAAADRFAVRRNQLDDALEQRIGANTMVPVRAVTVLRQQIEHQAAQAPQSRGPVLRAALQRLQAIEADTARNGGNIPFGTLRQIRTDLGRELERPDVSGYTPANETALRLVYGALREDIGSAAEAAGPDALRALRMHDRYVRFNRNINLPTLQKVVDQGTDAKAWQVIESGSRDSGQILARLRRNLLPQEWDVVAGSTLARLGRATPGQQGATELGEEGGRFSVNTFLTNWSRLAPEARIALFGGSRYADLMQPLNALVRVAERLKDADRLGNPSGTARNLIAGLGVIYAGKELVGGESPAGVAAELGAAVVAPRVAARLITSPRFIQWLARSTTTALDNPNALPAMFGRLATIATVEPEIREEIYEYLDALRRPGATGGPLSAPAASGEEPR